MTYLTCDAANRSDCLVGVLTRQGMEPREGIALKAWNQVVAYSQPTVVQIGSCLLRNNRSKT